MQQVSDLITKPIIPANFISNIVGKRYGMSVSGWKELEGYFDRNFHVRVEEETTNRYIQHVWKLGYVMKIMNSIDSRHPTAIESQHVLLNHLREKNINTPEPIKTIDGATMSLEKIYLDENQDESSDFLLHIIRLMKYIPGSTLNQKPFVPGTFYNIGRFVAEMHNKLEDFHHPYENDILWCLSKMDKVAECLFVVKSEKNLRYATEVIASFKANVEPLYNLLSKGHIHGDLNDDNIIVEEIEGQFDKRPEERVCEVTAILDFSEASKSYVIFDIAICIAYLTLRCKPIDQLDVAAHTIAGYLSTRLLNAAEKEVLKLCICARLVQSLVYGAHAHYKDPTNEYVLQTGKHGWSTLERLWNEPEQRLNDRWNRIIKSYDN